MKKIILIGMLLVLAGCVSPEQIKERKGGSIKIIPITHTLKIKTLKVKVAKEKLDKFYLAHNIQMQHSFIYISSFGRANKSIAKQLKGALVKRGIPQSMIILKVEKANYFNITLTFVENRALVEICSHEQIGSYGKNELGCSIESNRWLSLVNHKI